MSAVDEVFKDDDCPDPAEPYWTPETISSHLGRLSQVLACLQCKCPECKEWLRRRKEGTPDKRDVIAQATRDVGR